MSISTKYWQLLLTQGLLTGLGGGIIFTPCMGIMATYFNKKRAWAMGIASTGNSAGGLVYPVVVRQLLPQLGFGWTTRILAFINLAFLATVVALMKPRLPPRKTGPLMDWPAFKEPPYTLFVVAIFFQVWCIYFTLYYVRARDRHNFFSLLTHLHPGNLLRHPRNPPSLPILRCAAHHRQRHRHPRPSATRTNRRPSRATQHTRADINLHVHRRLVLAGRHQRHRRLRVRLLLRHHRRGVSVLDPTDRREFNGRYAKDRHALRHGVFFHGVWCAHGSADWRRDNRCAGWEVYCCAGLVGRELYDLSCRFDFDEDGSVEREVKGEGVRQSLHSALEECCILLRGVMI